MYSVFLFGIWGVFAQLGHAWITLPDVCFDTCAEAVGYAQFKGTTELDYYPKNCLPNLVTKSAFLCARYYCTEDQIQTGYNYVNSDVCEQFGGIPLAPFSIVDNVTDEEIEKMPRFGIADVAAGTLFNTTAIPNREFHDRAHRTVHDWAYQISIHAIYGWAMYGFWGVVILISLATKAINYLHRTYTRPPNQDTEYNGSAAAKSGAIWRSYSYLITYLGSSATFGGRCSEPYFWCTVPPLIESITVFAFVALNLIVCCVSYSAFDTNIYWSSRAVQMWRYISDRTGIIAFANLPLVWVFGTRNNILLWLTGWSFSTFNMFHRWVARVAVVQAIVHSIAYSIGFVLTDIYYEEWPLPYMIAGGIATVAMSLMLGFSVYGLRTYYYQLFLVIHIVLAAITLIACFIHANVYGDEYFGYLWSVVAIWVFDRVARIVRIILLNFGLLTGSQTATAWYSNDSETIYLDVPMSIDVKLGAGTNYYIYLLHRWKPWESHPFTATSILDRTSSGSNSLNNSSLQEKAAANQEIISKQATGSPKETTSSTLGFRTHRVRFAIRPYGGMTARLRDMLVGTTSDRPRNLRVLLEGPYGHAAGVKNFDSNVLIIGGSGITGALSHLESTAMAKSGRFPSIRLHWSVRHIAAFEEFKDELAAFCKNLDAKITVYVTREPETEVERIKAKENIYPSGWSVQYGRMSIPSVLREESDDTIGSMAVVGCGPARMMDQTRATSVHLALKESREIHYYQESFFW